MIGNSKYLIHFAALLVSVGLFGQATTKIVGRKICREAPGPEDTLQFNLVLQQGGTLKGSASFSGALGIVHFSKGTWRIRDGRIYVELTLAGAMSTGMKMEKTRRVKKMEFLVAELLSAKGCYEPQNIR